MLLVISLFTFSSDYVDNYISYVIKVIHFAIIKKYGVKGYLIFNFARPSKLMIFDYLFSLFYFENLL